MIDAILLAKQLGIRGYTVEVDSTIVFNMAKRQGNIQWRHIYLIRQLWALVDPDIKINLIVREQNMVADALAKEVQKHHSRMEFFTVRDLPRNIEKLLFYDRIGLPVFRASCK